MCASESSSLLAGSRNTLLDVIDIVQSLFAMRIANDALGWGLQSTPIHKQISVLSGRVRFAYDEFVSRYLNKNVRWRMREEFEEAVLAARRGFQPNPRAQMNGHDLRDVLEVVV